MAGVEEPRGPERESSSAWTRIARMGVGDVRSLAEAAGRQAGAQAKEFGAVAQGMGAAAEQIGEALLEVGDAVADGAAARWEQRQRDAERTARETEAAQQQSAGSQEFYRQHVQDAEIGNARRIGRSMAHTMADTEAAIATAERRERLREARSARAARAEESASRHNSANQMPGTKDASVEPERLGDLGKRTAPAIGANSAKPEVVERMSPVAPEVTKDKSKHRPAPGVAAADPAVLAARLQVTEHNVDNGARAETVMIATPGVIRGIGVPQVEYLPPDRSFRQDAQARTLREGPAVNSRPPADKVASPTSPREAATTKGLAKASDIARRGWEPPAQRDDRAADTSNPWLGVTAQVTKQAAPEQAASGQASPGQAAAGQASTQVSVSFTAAPGRESQVALGKEAGLG